MFAFSFWGEGGISFAAYKEVLLNKRQLGLLFNSFVLAGGTTILSIIWGVPFAFLISRTDFCFKKFFQYLYLTPLLIPPYISAISWIDLLGRQNFFHVSGILLSVWILGLSYFPFLTLLTVSGLKSVDRRLEETAQLSHPKIYVLKKITLPLVLPYIVAGAIFVFIFSIGNYAVPALLEVNTYPVEIFTQFSAFYNPQAATAVSAPLVLITLILILFQRYLLKNKTYVTIGSSSKKPEVFKLGKCKPLALTFLLSVISASVIIPIAVLLVRSGGVLSYKTAFKTGYHELFLSLGLSALGATLIIALGFFVSYIIERSKGKAQAAIDIISLLPFAVPATVLGIGLIRVWNHPFSEFIYGSSAIILFGYIARFSPFSIRAISSNVKQINPNLEESADICGAGWWRRFWRILLPLSKPGLLAGWLIAFVLSLGELGTTLLVIPPGKATLPIKIYNVMHYGASKLVAALSIILILVSLFFVLIVYVIFHLRRKTI